MTAPVSNYDSLLTHFIFFIIDFATFILISSYTLMYLFLVIFCIVTARFITMAQGNRLLLLNNYTYSRSGKIRNCGSRYSCCLRSSRGCKANVHLTKDEIITSTYLEHNHDPGRLIRTLNGKYIKIKS